jgi:serine/threonine-protein kinase
MGTPAAALAAPVASSNAPASRPVRRNNTASAASPRAHAAVTPAGEPVPAPPPEPGVLTLAIAPWGEVFVDGTSVGVSPPLSRLSLSPGTHAIEVHNGGFPVYAAQVEISPGGTLALQHRF